MNADKTLYGYNNHQRAEANADHANDLKAQQELAAQRQAAVDVAMAGGNMSQDEINRALRRAFVQGMAHALRHG